jgi:Uma2 family endonuclease
MPKMLLPRDRLKEIIRERRRTGAIRHDEVWDGVYVMSPDPDNQHQWLAFELAIALRDATADIAGRLVYPTINLTDRQDDWRKNFRIPDASVFLPGNPAEDRLTHWFGGPDFAVEILSPGDRSRKKFSFYAKVGVRELLLADRDPWRLELHRRGGSRWRLVGSSSPDQPTSLASAVIPLTFRLLPGDPRPQVEVTKADGTRWLV